MPHLALFHPSDLLLAFAVGQAARGRGKMAGGWPCRTYSWRHRAGRRMVEREPGRASGRELARRSKGSGERKAGDI